MKDLRCGLVAAMVAVLVVSASRADFVPGDQIIDLGPDRVLLPDEFAGYASDQIVVRFLPGVVNDDGVVAGDVSIPAFEDLNAKWKVISIERSYPWEFKHPEVAAKYGLDRSFLLRVPAGTDAIKMADEYAQLVDVVEHANFVGIGGTAFIPNDSDFPELYGMHNTGQTGGTPDADIDAVEAWDIHTGVDGQEITIAIIDSGVDPHPEFASRMVPGINTNDPNNEDLTTDGCPHGTHVTGTVAATGNNVQGVAGVNWGVKVMPVRVLSGCGGTNLQCANGIIWATDNGADVGTMSLQYYTPIQEFEDSVNYAHDLGTLLIAATGNNAFPEQVAWPAKYENCMAVGATDHNDNIASFSNAGPEIDVSGPGVNVYSTWVGNGYTFLDGTSMATPHVSGLATLMWSYNADLTNDDIRAILTATAEDKGPAGFDEDFGFGRINAVASMAVAGGVPEILSSDPPTDAIDARQHKEPDGTNRDGWDVITVTLDAESVNLSSLIFDISQEGSNLPTPTVVSVVQGDAPNEVVVTLNHPIRVGMWTVIKLVGSESTIRLAHLPADVDNDETSSADDVLVLIDALNGLLSLPDYQTDIDRSGESTAADVLRVIDLLNGANEYNPFLGVSLP